MCLFPYAQDSINFCIRFNFFLSFSWEFLRKLSEPRDSANPACLAVTSWELGIPFFLCAVILWRWPHSTTSNTDAPGTVRSTTWSPYASACAKRSVRTRRQLSASNWDWLSLSPRMNRGDNTTPRAVLLAREVLRTKKGKSPWDWLLEAEEGISHSSGTQLDKRFSSLGICSLCIKDIIHHNQCVCWCCISLSWCFREKQRTRRATESYSRVCALLAQEPLRETYLLPLNISWDVLF